MKEISVSTIYNLVAPYAAPAPSAYVMGLNVYKSIMVASDGANWILAALVAIIGVIGIESTGGLSAILISRAYVNKAWGTMGLAALALAAYASFVAWGIWVSDDSRPMLSTVGITLLAYVVVALWEGMKEISNVQASNLAAVKANASLIRAQNKSVQLSNGQNNPSTGQTGHAAGQLDTAILEQARAYFGANPNASARDWLREPNCPVKSPTSASKYRAAL